MAFNKTTKKRIDAATDDIVFKYVVLGWSSGRLGQYYGCCHKVILRRLHKRGLVRQIEKDYSKMNADQRYRYNNPEKRHARRYIQYRVAAGKIKREPCERCGDTPTHAHHEDYSRPHDIVWLCHKCHFEIHKQRGDFRFRPPRPPRSRTQKRR